MELPRKCIFSGSADSLNTQMTVNIEGKPVQVWISDEYAESATPKMVKDKVLEVWGEKFQQQREIEQLQKRASELGLTLSPKAPSFDQAPPPEDVLSEEAPPPEEVPPVPRSIPSSKPKSDGRRIVDGRTADTRTISPRVSGSAGPVSGAGREYEIKTSEKPTEDLKAGEQAEIGLVKGRAGLDLAIPVRRVGKTGETTITIVDTGGDKALQERFKDMARQSEDNPPDFIHGYPIRTVRCALCGGSGTVMGNRSCPKCGGAGSMDVMV